MFLKHFLTLQSLENSENGIDSISQTGLEIPKHGSTPAPLYQRFWKSYLYVVSKQIKLLHNKLEVEEHDCDIFETFWSLLGALRSHWSRKLAEFWNIQQKFRKKIVKIQSYIKFGKFFNKNNL